MNRLQATFETTRKQGTGGRKLLCPFFTAGYPSLEATPALLLAAQQAGAGIIELGIPFSDPIADGPVIQASFTQALAAGVTVPKALACVAQARKLGLTLPVMAMVSFSIVFKRGVQNFAAQCRENDLDGIILPDISLEEAPPIVEQVHEAGLGTTLLVAPTTPPERRRAIAKLCDAFVYYLSVSGITGERKELPADIALNVQALRGECDAPICVGFGISTPEQVHAVTRVADGAIVGSAVIRRIAQNAGQPIERQAEGVGDLIRNLAKGL